MGVLSRTCDRRRDDTSSAVAPVFVFPAVGPMWWATAQELLPADGAFAAAARWVDEVFIGITGSSMLAELHAAAAAARVPPTALARPATLLLQTAFCTELAAAGCVPTAVLGRGVGAAAAAYVSGALTLHDALLVSCDRDPGRLARLRAGVPGVALHSAATGTAVTEVGTGADHRCEDGRPDRFVEALDGIVTTGRRVVVELGPYPDIRGVLERANAIGTD